ncbi:hypothetical protein SEA_MORIZZLED23_72 [Mycobacterium phage Morizzled23]|nr:hypothetical protein SEA_MORIZZLED23_72 [Mycobacterium phage Morizzled23]
MERSVMTLNTNIAVRLPAEHNLTPRQVFDELVKALIHAGGPWSRDLSENIFDPNPTLAPASIKMPKTEKSEGGETGSIYTVLGQGFHGITDIEYRVDGSPLYPKDVTNGEVYPEDYDLDDPDEAERAQKVSYPACWYLLSVDTAYGYRPNPGHMDGVTGCTSLHAAAIGIFNQWVVAQGGSVIWENEYAGTWHTMDDEEGWANFAGNGAEAMSWFKNTIPVVVATYGSSNS